MEETKKQQKFFEVMKALCNLMNQYPSIMKQRSLREVFESGIYLWGVVKYNGQKTKFKYLSSDVKKGTHLHYEHVVPVDFFIKYFLVHIQTMSFKKFSEIIQNNCEVCGVSDEVNEQLNKYRSKMPDNWNFGDKKWQCYIECNIDVKDSMGKAVDISSVK